MLVDAESINQALILVTGVAGQMFVAHRRISGFYFWIVTNLALIAAAWQTQSWGMLLLYVFYTGMCVYSIRKWKGGDGDE